MGAIFPNETNIYIAPAATAGSALATSDKVTTEITNFGLTGGGKDTESVPLFGGAFITKELPREQYEIALDVVVSYDNAVRWEALLMGGDLASSSCESSGDSSDWRIFITSTDGSLFKTIAMDNCKAVTFEPEMAADEYQKGTINFKFSPTDEDAASNLKAADVIHSNAYFN